MGRARRQSRACRPGGGRSVRRLFLVPEHAGRNRPALAALCPSLLRPQPCRVAVHDRAGIPGAGCVVRVGGAGAEPARRRHLPRPGAAFRCHHPHRRRPGQARGQPAHGPRTGAARALSRPRPGGTCGQHAARIQVARGRQIPAQGHVARPHPRRGDRPPERLFPGARAQACTRAVPAAHARVARLGRLPQSRPVPAQLRRQTVGCARGARALHPHQRQQAVAPGLAGMVATSPCGRRPGLPPPYPTP